MGIIIKQSIKGSIWSYLGLIVGYVNLGIIMPNFFAPEQIGLIQLFAAVSIIFAQFSTLGFSSVINRMFPYFRDKQKGHNGFLFLAVTTGILGFVISTIAFIVLKPHIIETNIEKSPLLVEYISFIMPLVFFRVMYILLDNYNRVLYDAVTGTFWSEFVHKTINLLLIISFTLGMLNFRQFFFGYIVSLSMPVLPLIIVLIKRGEFKLKPQLNFIKKPFAKEIIIVAAFGLFNGFSGMLITNVDKVLINQYLSLEQVGIFSVCALFATIIKIPSVSVVKISTGIIAEAWKRNDTKKIQEIYSKASINQTIIGALIFAGLIINLESIFTILPEVYSQGKWVLLIYSFTILIQTSNTLGGTIIVTSKHYKVLTYIILLNILLIIAMNLVLIPIYGITGAAIAIFLTYTTITFIVVIYLIFKFEMFCYSLKHVQVLVIAGIIIIVGIIIPRMDILIVDIILRSAIASLLYIIFIYALKTSEDLNQLGKKLYNFVVFQLFSNKKRNNH